MEKTMLDKLMTNKYCLCQKIFVTSICCDKWFKRIQHDVTWWH